MDQKTCKVCGNGADFYSPYLKKYLCRKHFEKMIIRRLSKIVTSEGMKSKGYRLDDDGSDAHRLLAFVFKEDKGSGVRLSNLTMEDFALETMKYFTDKRYRPRVRISTKTSVSPLYTTSEGEIRDFLAAKNIVSAGRKRDAEDEWLLNFIRGFEERRPGGMISLVRIGNELEII